MLKKFTAIIAFSLLALTTLAQNRDDILGKWLNPAGEGQVEIYKKGDRYFGKLIWIKEPNNEKGKPKLDNKNPNVSFRSRSILGLEILKDFVFEDSKWTDGTIYDPNTGKTYSCNLALKDNGQLTIRGYIGISLIGRSEVWKKVK